MYKKLVEEYRKSNRVLQNFHRLKSGEIDVLKDFADWLDTQRGLTPRAPDQAEQKFSSLLECPWCHRKHEAVKDRYDCPCGALCDWEDWCGSGYVWKWYPPETKISNRSVGG